MKVKYKLFLSLLFLLGVIVLVGGFGSYYLRWLAKDSAAIIQNNNRSLTYLRTIEGLLDDLQYMYLIEKPDDSETAKIFSAIDESLVLQQANITEAGEQEFTDRFANDLERLQKMFVPEGIMPFKEFKSEAIPLIRLIRDQSQSIYLINEEIMLQRKEQAAATAEKAVLYMNIFGGSSVLIALVFIIGLPIYISKPLETFAVALKEISNGNYKVNVPIRSRDEYGKLAGLFNLMVGKLDAYENSNLAKMINEQKRLNAVINHMDEAILGLDECKKVIFANDHCLRLLGVEREAIIGEYASKFAAGNQLMENLIQELMIDFMPFEEKVYPPIAIVDNRRERLFSKNIINVMGSLDDDDKKKSLMGHVIVLTDITDFTEKDKAKTHFIATLSHELKTPVSAILMSTNLLRNARTGTLGDGQRELIDTIESNSERIRRTINEILDLSKIESGTIDLNLSSEFPDNLIHKAVEGVRLFLEDKKLGIHIVGDSNLPMIKVDAHKLVWILNNLLTNAIRYSPEGSSIQIKTSLHKKLLKISVIDQGLGIAIENQDRIFRKFSRLNNSEDSGTGLGLAISKEFVEAMGGSIGVESREREGAEFWIKLNAVS